VIQEAEQPAIRPSFSTVATPMLDPEATFRRTVGIGMLGMGVVGAGLARALQERAAGLAASVGASLVIEAIVVQDADKRRDDDLPLHLVTADAVAVLDNPDVDIVVEVIGGVEQALDYVLKAIRSGKHVVTANKDLMARHGPEILDLAHEANVSVLFEASVGAGTPMVAPLTRSLLANCIVALRGILNGTTNYILTKMELEGASLDQALVDAQRLGYAEADPRSDLTGSDAARKLAILSSLAWGTRVRDTDVYCEGITWLETRDFECAARLGYTIKLLAIASEDRGEMRLRVHPALVRKGTAMASVDGVLNALEIDGDLTGPVLLRGAGAGPASTASALIADIVEVSRGIVGGLGRINPVNLAREVTIQSMAGLETRHLLRLSVTDVDRIQRDVIESLRDDGVLVDHVTLEPAENELVLLTGVAEETVVQRAISGLRLLDGVLEVSSVIRVDG
jgi:homoserine dehydrogenase